MRFAAEDVVGAEVDHAGAALVAVLGQRLWPGHVGELGLVRQALADIGAGQASGIEQNVEFMTGKLRGDGIRSLEI